MNRLSRALHSHLAEIVASIERGRVAVKHRKPLAEWLTASIEAADGRGKATAERNRQRAARLREAIRRDAGFLLAERPGLSEHEVVAIVRRRLLTQAIRVGERLVRVEVRHVLACRPRTGATYSLCDARDTSTQPTT